MSQDITWLGARYPTVDYIDLPKTSSGVAYFHDVTPTTATASDVAQGKIFFTADGTQTTGTASGGGGASVAQYVIRPDATIVEKYTYDKLVVHDLEITIPSYSTTAKTVVSSASLTPTVTMDDDYDYFITQRGICYPIYNQTTKAKGRTDHYQMVDTFETCTIPTNTIPSLDKTKYHGQRQIFVIGKTAWNKLVYWSASTTLSFYSGSNGIYLTPQTPTLSGTTITVKSPSLAIKGSTNYLNQTYWGYMTDIRYQYVIEVWKVAKSSTYQGWDILHGVNSIINDIASNGGTLR